MFVCILLFIPSPITENYTGLPSESGDLDQASLLSYDADAKPLEGSPWNLFKFYIWNRAVIYIFLANMLNSLFNSIVGSDQVTELDISEVGFFFFFFLFFFIIIISF